jgi:hypothetical protein
MRAAFTVQGRGSLALVTAPTSGSFCQNDPSPTRRLPGFVWPKWRFAGCGSRLGFVRPEFHPSNRHGRPGFVLPNGIPPTIAGALRQMTATPARKAEVTRSLVATLPSFEIIACSS